MQQAKKQAVISVSNKIQLKLFSSGVNIVLLDAIDCTNVFFLGGLTDVLQMSHVHKLQIVWKANCVEA